MSSSGNMEAVRAAYQAFTDGDLTAIVRELHVWHVNDGQLLGLEVFLNAPTPLLAALGS